MTNFFQQLALMMNGFDLQITVRKHKDSTLTVSVVPTVKDKEKAPAPMAFTGTPEELDTDLFKEIKEPLEKHAGMISNTKAFEESSKKTAEKAAPVNSNAPKKAEAPKPKPIDVALAAGDAAMAKKEWPVAIKEYEKALKIEPTSKVVKTKLLEAKTNKMKKEAGLFDDEPETTTTTADPAHVPGTITPNPKADAAVEEQEVDEFGEEDPADETLEADPTNDDEVDNF